MNRVFLIFALLFASSAIYAQHTVLPSGAERRVVNEDRGIAYIVTAETQPPLSSVKRASKLPHQFSVFLGDGWNRDELRLREPSLANLFASPLGLSTELMDAIMNKNDLEVGQFIEVPFSSPTGSVSDLQIQQQIQFIAKSDSRTIMGIGTIVVIYLDSSLHSRFTDLESGKHYVAYENTVNINDARIRYAVVPMDINAKRAETVARTAFLCAMVDP